MIKSRTRALFAAAAVAIMLALPAEAVSGMTQKSAQYVINSNSAPIAENIDIETYKGIPVTGSLKAVDPEGEAITFTLISAPKKGTVELKADGSFTYTPTGSKKGKDSFKFTASDENGNISETAVVNINICKRKSEVTYSDMQDDAALYPALKLDEEGIFTGEKLGGEYFFDPSKEVSRGEFLAMCMKLCDIKNLDGISKTGFYDDDSIAPWLKPYVSTALVAGVISGSVDADGNHVFSPESAISYAEASVMLDNALDISDVAVNSAESTWWYQSAMNLTACNILESGTVHSAVLTRADAAELLAGAMEFLENRK